MFLIKRMVNSKIDIDEVIYKLLQGLRRKGYSIGTDTYIKTTDLFHWFLKEKKGEGIADFAPYLAPLVCKSDDEQTSFKQLYHDLFANEFEAFEKFFFNARKQMEEEERKKKDKILKYLGLLLLSGLLLFGIYKLWQYKNLPPKPYYENLLTQPFYVNKNDSVAFSENPVFKKAADTSKFNVEYNIHKAKKIRTGFAVRHSFEAYGKDTITVKIKSIKPGIDSTLEFSEVYVGPEKLLITPQKNEIERGEENEFTANIDSTIHTDFYWEITKTNDSNNIQNPIGINVQSIKYVFKEEGDYLVKVKYDKTKTAFLKDFPDEKLSTSYYQKVTTPGLHLDVNYTLPVQNINVLINKFWVAGLLFLSMILFYNVYKVFKNNPAKNSSSNKPSEHIFSGDKPPYDLYFSDRNKNINYTYDLLRLSNHLKKRIDSPDLFLDISKTIRQSIVNRGFPTPGFSQKQQTRQCLFLIEQAYKNSQQVKLFSYLAMYLIQRQVKLDFYFYYQTPDKFYTHEDAPRITLQTLKDRYYNCSLIFFTDGTNFPQYNAALLKETITTGFSYWQQRILVTPLSYNDWGRNEKLLSTFFKVLPADVAGLLELIRVMDTDSTDTTMLPGQVNTYESKYVDFSTIRGLQEYLNDDELFQWLCALAIHPKIYWEAILEIGKTIIANPAKINYETLLKLARIQWVHEGNFPTTIRLELLKALTRENEIKARDVFLKMLDEIQMGDDMFSYEEKQISRYTNSFVLFATGIQKYTSDKNIQDGEERFISLYKNENISDNVLKIYIEKKETEQGNWNTPITYESENIGIEKYITAKEKAQSDKIQSERLKRNKKLARYAAGAIASLLLLGYIFFNKVAIVKSNINEYLKLADTTIVADKNLSVNIAVNNECFRNLLLISKDSIAFIEASTGSTILYKNNIKFSDSLAYSFALKNLSFDSSKTINYKLIVNEQRFIKEMPLRPGSDSISLIGCEKESLNIYYNIGYNEDTTAVFNAFKGTDYSIKVIPTTDNYKPKANMITFDSAIGKNEIYSYADNLIKAGFPLKSVAIKNKQTAQKNIVIDGQDSLNKLPNFTREQLRKSLFSDAINIPPVKIFYGDNVSTTKIMQVKNCLKNDFSVSTVTKTIPKLSVNMIKYFRESFKDSAKKISNCLQTYFPERVFEITKSTSLENSNVAAEIYLPSDSKTLPQVLVAISDEILRPQAYKLMDALAKVGYSSNGVFLENNINSSIIEYHAATQLNDANNIKKIYSKYFSTSQVSLKYVDDPQKKYISVQIKKLNDVVKEKFFISDAKFQEKIKMQNKLQVAFAIGFDNFNNASAPKIYTGKVCLSENSNKQTKSLDICENFSFSNKNKTIISKEIDASYSSSGRYSIRVIVEELKVDTILGYTQIEYIVTNPTNANNPPASVTSNNSCDTIHSYIGMGKGNILFKGKRYLNIPLKDKGIEFSLLERDPKYASFSISKDKCPLDKISFYIGETKTITFCDGTKITLTMLNWENKTGNKKNEEAIFDAIICKTTKIPRVTKD
jgi:hypothetical protein